MFRNGLSFCIFLLTLYAFPAQAADAIDGNYLSDKASYLDMQQGRISLTDSAKLELELGVRQGKMQFIRIRAPWLEGIDRLYSRVRGMGCVYTSLGYPVMYPGAVIRVNTKTQMFEVKYSTSNGTIFGDRFVVTNLDDQRSQNYQWISQVGRIWFDDAPLHYDAPSQSYRFHVSPTFLPENYGGHYRQEGELKGFNDLNINLKPPEGTASLQLSCPKVRISFHLKKTEFVP